MRLEHCRILDRYENLESMRQCQDSPKRDDTDTQIRSSKADMRLPLMPKTYVLIIDDDKELLAGLRRNLRRAKVGWVFYFADNVAEAMELVQTQKVDVVLSDMRMPDMHGAELLAHFAARYPDTLRVAFSEQYDPLMTSILTPCPHHYVSKPVRIDWLIQVVSDWLVKHRQQLSTVG